MQNQNRIQGIQALRFLAAYFVVNYHFYAAVPRINSNAEYPEMLSQGYIGVDIFFMISGYVIAMTVFRSSANFDIFRFFYKRASRIYPTYWVITIIILIGMAFFPNQINRSNDLEPSVVKSLFLFPHEGNPILNVGWSLEFEVWFYVLIALAVLLFRNNYLVGILFVLVLTVVAPETNSEVLKLILSPYNFEFALGVMIFKAEQVSGTTRRRVLTAALYITPIVAMLIVSHAGLQTIGSDWDRVLVSLSVASLVFACVRIIEPIFNFGSIGRIVSYLGDISYAIYLTHVITLNIALIGMKYLELHENLYVLIIGVNATVLGASVIFYKIFDEPLQRLTRKVL